MFEQLSVRASRLGNSRIRGDAAMIGLDLIPSPAASSGGRCVNQRMVRALLQRQIDIDTGNASTWRLRIPVESAVSAMP